MHGWMNIWLRKNSTNYEPSLQAFELATGDFLFDPHASRNFTRSQHHVACFVELLGDIPKTFAISGKLYSKYFNKKGRHAC